MVGTLGITYQSTLYIYLYWKLIIIVPMFLSELNTLQALNNLNGTVLSYESHSCELQILSSDIPLLFIHCHVFKRPSPFDLTDFFIDDK